MVIRVKVLPQQPIVICLESSDVLHVHVSTITRMLAEDVKIYGGPYEAIPKVEEQTLETAQKFMTDDLKIRAVPYYEVSNDQGGNTVYIAKEI